MYTWYLQHTPNYISICFNSEREEVSVRNDKQIEMIFKMKKKQHLNKKIEKQIKYQPKQNKGNKKANQKKT